MKASFKPIHRRDIIVNGRLRWLDQYKYWEDERLVSWGKGLTIGSIRDAVKKLNLETCSHDAISRAGAGWGQNRCSECGKDVAVLLRIGDDSEYDSRYVDLCRSCLKKANDLFNSVKAKK